jgi:hypothetical protein
MKELLLSLLPILRPLLEVFITVVAPTMVTWLAYRLVSLLKITDDKQKAEVEATLRDALHESAKNALLYAMTQFGLSGSGTNMSQSVMELSRKAGAGDAAAQVKLEGLVDMAVNNYLIPKMPETIKKLKATPEGLADIVISKVPAV